ncbi:hypothetical protein C1646_814122 [Rhizophagus diaphanus]|nr:hypothetical protein C1646_814122 [Rhizophagus diaphanus] [Rhizophagus sp. MUCL 43196]
MKYCNPLPEDGPIDDQLPQIDNVEQCFNDDDDVYEDMIRSNFVPAPLPLPNEEQAISNTLNRVQDNDIPITWPNIDGTPINEFQTPSYIACAFPTLYPTRNGDLRSNHIRENLEDYWYRFKWQHRGSPHVHGIGKRKDSPSIDWKKMKEDEDMMNNVVRYLDSLITTKNPDRDAPVPAQHPYNNGQPELITARNDDMNTALQYVSKYTSKSEPCSAAFSEILNKILNENAPNASSLPVFQGLLLHTVTERDILAQKTCHLLLSIPLYHSSYQFVTLNFNKLTHRWLCETGDNNEESFLANSEWKLCKKENIVRIWPRLSPQIDGPQWEEFCHIIENDPVDILVSPVDNLENESNDEDKDSSELGLWEIDRNYDWVVLMLTGNIEALNVIIMGTASTEKLYLINMISRNHNITEHSLILVLTPTGVAAFNICGIIIHSVLSIPISNNKLDLNSECLKKLQKKLEGVEYLIIDEKSMSDVAEFNVNKLKSLNCPVAIIKAIHTGEVGLVNRYLGTVQEIVFEENQSPPSLPIAVLIEFDNYSGPAIIIEEGPFASLPALKVLWLFQFCN